MASSLASQLEALAVRGGQAPNVNKKTRPSLIFSPSDAADVDLRSIFDLCELGLEDLARTDRRFEAYRKTIFSEETLKLDRELQSRELNEKLNSSIATFLRVLSNYIMLKPAHQILEYLIRRYKVHVYNVDDILICVLPYHETSLFVRVVQLLQLRKSKWAFLEGVQRSGAAPTRAALVNQCISDPGMLETLCEAAMKVARVPSKSRTVASLAAIIVMEVLAAVPKVETATVNRILPFILLSFESGVTEDYQVGALMVVGTLANRASLSPSLVETLTVAIAGNIQNESAVEGAPLIRVSLMVMIQLMQTQAVETFPVEAFKILVKLRVFFELLAKLTEMYDASRLLSLYLEVHVKHCAEDVLYEQSLVNMINTVPLKDYVGHLVTSILQLYMKDVVEDAEQQIGNEREVAKRLFEVLERRFPTELDSAISSCLQNGQASGKSAIGSALHEALHEIFLGSLHMPLVESNKTLYSSLDHPDARVREAAVRRLAELDEEQNSSMRSEMKDMMWEALLQRAHKDDQGVLLAILSVKSLVRSPSPERVFKMLTSIISTGINAITAGGKTNTQAIVTTSTALKLLASDFLALHPSFADRVSTILFGLLVTSPKTLKVNLVALEFAKKLPFALYKTLPEIQDPASDQDGLSKGPKKKLALVINEKVVSSLATSLLNNHEEYLTVLFECAAESSRSKCLALAVLLRLFQDAPEDRILSVVKASFPWLREQFAVLESEQGFDLKNARVKQDEYKAAKIPFVSYEVVLEKPILVQAELFLKIFYQLVKVVHMSSKGEAIECTSTLEREESLKELYELFASSRFWDEFSPHLQLLLIRLSDDVFSFLSYYFVYADFEASPLLHRHSFDLLGSFYSQLPKTIAERSSVAYEDMVKEWQTALPALVIGLASPVKDVRRSASECLSQLYKLSVEHRSISLQESESLRTDILQPDTFEKVLKALVDAATACTSNDQYVVTVLAILLNESEDENFSRTQQSRLNPVACKAVVNFFIARAVKLSTVGQVRVSTVAQKVLFSVLKGTGHEVELLRAAFGILENLLERRARHHLLNNAAPEIEKISPADLDFLVTLLQMYTAKAAAVLAVLAASATAENQPFNHLLEALKVDVGSTADPVIVRPCIAALGCLTADFFKHLPFTVMEQVFRAVVELSSSTCTDIHAAAQAVLHNITISAKVIAVYLRRLSSQSGALEVIPAKKKRRVKEIETTEFLSQWSTPQQQLSCTAALLEVLAWLPNIEDREELVAPLYQLLNHYRSSKWQSTISDLVTSQSREDGATPLVSLDYIQQLIFINLERLATAILSNTNPDQAEIFDINVLVQCVADTSDPATRNQALMLLTAIARVFPQKVLNHIVDIFSVIGASTITQDDKYSHDVTQQLLVVVVPFWLKMNKNPMALLQVIVKALPQVPVHRRMSLVTTLLRVMGENKSLHVFLMLLLRTTNGEGVLEQNRQESRDLQTWEEHWEVKFARDLCQEYEPRVWLPALVKLLKATSACTSPAAIQFITYQIQGLSANIRVQVPQGSFVSLLGQVVMQLQTSRRENQSSLIALLDCLTLVMAPIAYLEGLINLLKKPDNEIRQKVLVLYTTRMKMQDDAREQPPRRNKVEQKPVDEKTVKKEQDLQEQMVSLLSGILLASAEDASEGVKLAAVEALEKCASKLASTSRAGSLVNILPAAVAVLKAKKKALCVAGVRSVGTLVSILGPRALPSLPDIVTELLNMGRDATPSSSSDIGVNELTVTAGTDIVSSVLKTLGVVIDNLGAFLNPYLSDIISFLALQPSVIKASDANVTSNAVAVRELLATKIAARLLLDPLIGAYEQSLITGPEAASALFDMVAAVASTMDRASVSLYHVKVFNACLRALDLRCNRPSGFASIEGVEKSVIGALSSLVLKLSENSFKPLFVSLLDWAQTSSVENGLSGTQLDRRISFFGLVHQLLEKLRSLFVPYFSFLLDVCVSTLADGQNAQVFGSSGPKKKKKRASVDIVTVGLSYASWHLRSLVLSSLHKCFLYDTVGFLDSARFQQLLGPVVSQLLVDAPPGLSDSRDQKLTTVEEMDDIIVSCVSQMALTSGSDLFWKPLNREVLMCTRSKKLRPRLLALRVVKLLVEHLKEEYLVLLPETLPFLAELLEDSELVVVAKSQEIIKILETNSGESLSQYF